MGGGFGLVFLVATAFDDQGEDGVPLGAERGGAVFGQGLLDEGGEAAPEGAGEAVHLAGGEAFGGG